MKSSPSSRSHFRLAAPIAAVLSVLAISSPARAQQQSPPPGGGEEEIQQTVARVAYRSGPATYSRGDDPENWQDVEVNVPLTLGDRVYTGKDGRLELNTGGTRIFVAPETQLTALDLRDDVRQISVSVGTATFRVRRLAEGEVFEVDTPNVSVTFRRPGNYRIDVDADGNTRFVLHEGGALGVAAGGQVDLNQGDTMEVEGTDEPRYDLVAQPAPDRWDRWVDDRVKPRGAAVSAKYVPDEVVGTEDLDEDGSWENIPEQGMAWTPRGVDAGWAPYRDGRWMWQDPWGWSWVGAERWGWAPYHYGSWTSYRNRWFWLPGARGDHGIHYSPARVVFAGGPPGHGVMGGHVGWFPVGPREPFSPWWGHRPVVPIPLGFGFMNRGYMHAVRHDTFVGGGFVQRSFVRDAAIMRGLASAPFLHGPLPFLPTPASIRMPFPAGHRGPMLRPPDAFISRSVVTRLAPPLAPPGFSTKVGFIKENHGMPVDRRVSERLSVDQFKGARPVADIRPASDVGGKVGFAAKRDFGSGHKVQPISAPREGQGRALATHDRPVGIQSKELQSYQRPVADTRGQQGAKSFGQGQGQQTQGQGQFNARGRTETRAVGGQGTTTGGQGQAQVQGQGRQGGNSEGLVKVQGQGQQTTGRQGGAGQGDGRQGGKAFGQGQAQGQSQDRQSAEKKGASSESFNKQGSQADRSNRVNQGNQGNQGSQGNAKSNVGQSQTQTQGQSQHKTGRRVEGEGSSQQGTTRSSGPVQGQQTTRRNDPGVSSQNQRSIGQGQQSQTMSKKTDTQGSGSQGSGRSSAQGQQSTTRSADRPVVKQQAVRESVAKQQPLVRREVQQPPARQAPPQKQAAPPQSSAPKAEKKPQH